MQDDCFLQVPTHVKYQKIIEADLMVTKLFAHDIDDKGKHGSLTNVISVWNSMVGSGLLTIPWAFS
jgi:hypothetical protein